MDGMDGGKCDRDRMEAKGLRKMDRMKCRKD